MVKRWSIVDIVGDEPITLTAAKTFLRITGNLEDDEITDEISSARRYAEDILGFSLVEKTITEVLTEFPADAVLELAQGRVKSVETLTYYDELDDEQTFDVSKLTVDPHSFSGRVYLNFNESWPTSLSTREMPIIIEYTVSDYMDETIKLGIKKLISQQFVNRENADARPGEAIALILRSRKLYGF